METDLFNTENDENAEKDRMLQLCTDIWNDYRSGAMNYKSLVIEAYTRKYQVSKFPKTLVIPILLQSEKPTMEDAKRLRTEINAYMNIQRTGYVRKEDCVRKEDREKKEEPKAVDMTVQMAIEVLKQKGYRVMKKTTAYIDL